MPNPCRDYQQGYAQGCADGFTRASQCRCADDFDTWTHVYEAGWHQGYAAAVTEAHPLADVGPWDTADD